MQKQRLALRTQEEIMRNWREQNSPLVSVVCITYNHEPYIRDAIEGFLMQETSFPFEIIIHDDASLDKTADIVKSYEEQYPKLIKGIYQTENQYSQGKKCSAIAWSYAKGEYIALCEGDDYWTDPQKLQIQIDEMRKHPEVDMSFHPAIIKYDDNECPQIILSRHFKINTIVNTKLVILGNGGFCPTASLIIRREVIQNFPDWFYSLAPVGDYFMQIFGSSRGGASYIDRTMSVYRKQFEGSWTQKMDNINNYLEFVSRFNHSIEKIDVMFNFEYHKCFQKIKADMLLTLAMRYLKINQYNSFRNYIKKSYAESPLLSFRQTILYYTRFFPFLFPFGYKLKLLFRTLKKDRFNC